MLLAAHGTRFAPGRAAVEQLRGALERCLDGPSVVLGWVDVCEPRACDVVRDGDVLVPAFLGDGFHVRHDVPEAAAAARDVVVTPHLGTDGRLLDALDARVREAGGPWPCTLLAWAGSRNPASREATGAVARAMAGRWGVDVRIVTPANLDEVLAGLRLPGGAGAPAGDGGGAAGAAAPADRRATPGAGAATDAGGARAAGGAAPGTGLASWLLAPGLFSERFAATGLPCSAPLGDHPAVVEALAALVTDAVR